MRRQITRRFREREAEDPYDERADADNHPDASPRIFWSTGDAAGEKRQRGSDWPHTGPTDEVDDGQDTAANGFRRVFAGISEGKRLLGAKSNPGNKAADDHQYDARGQRAEDGEDAEQQQIELINESPAEPIAELTLAGGADEHAEDGGAAYGSDFGSRRELRLKDERNE